MLRMCMCRDSAREDVEDSDADGIEADDEDSGFRGTYRSIECFQWLYTALIVTKQNRHMLAIATPNFTQRHTCNLHLTKDPTP